MTSLPKKAYVPPHLRKRATDVSAATNEKATAPVSNGCSTTSVQSKPGDTAILQSSTNGACIVPGQPPSPPTTPREPVTVEPSKVDRVYSPQQVEPNSGTAADGEDVHVPGWDDPKPEQAPTRARRDNPNWPRGPKPQPRKRWLKQSEMRARSTDSSSDGGVACRSDSNGDPDYDVKKLMDWNGDWLPPPEQWSARKGHTNRHLGQAMEQWINGHDEECTKDIKIESHLAENGFCKEIVPKYWVITRIEQDSLGSFWKQFPERAPAPVSDIDVMAVPPFWERYEDGTSFYLKGLIVPDATVDPSDPENNFRGVDMLVSATERVRVIEENKARRHARTLARQRRPLRESVLTGPPQEDRRIVPKSNVYFRPVQPADVYGIAVIYNHYVEATIHANEFEGRTEEHIRNRIDDIIESGLPYLVAVARGNQPKGPTGFVSEKIVGYASLDDWADKSSMYRYTFELQLYVHPGYVSQNIASCLLDRLLEMANTGYNARGGYDYRNGSEYLKTGPSRVIKTIVLQVHEENGQKVNDTSKFLKQFNFSCAGHIAHMGFKLGKIVDLFLYRHTTTEIIDANARPTIAS
ncbi:hypothetical protein EK21DRAFT_74592 [Setomelanomma holmii]|uniref:N-acetyltransferase domain-containing protein n=1 Tax=Setomelanomma holmii TaxID=210430 RepID=A0A9P4H273_9PLEO|nr:hypothetical protein EK21DRAFT_74592 [Setomelanomma holmii]